MQLLLLARGRVLQLRALGRASPRLESARSLAVWYVCPQRSHPHLLWSSLLFSVGDQAWAPSQAVGPEERSLLSPFPPSCLPSLAINFLILERWEASNIPSS